MLEITDLHARIDDKKILKGIDLLIRQGEIHAIMGPNGSGKSTLCNVLMGHPKYKRTKGNISLNGLKLNTLEPNERALAGLFLAFQQPMEIAGVSFGTFLRLAKNQQLDKENKIGPMEFFEMIKKSFEGMQMDESFIGRPLNGGFSGGEKKRAEIVQMDILEPAFALLDEIDSGLDIDALKTVAKGISRIHKKKKTGLLIITHYERILSYITPDKVHIMHDGKIIKSGGPALAKKLEKEGYDQFIK